MLAEPIIDSSDAYSNNGATGLSDSNNIYASVTVPNSIVPSRSFAVSSDLIPTRTGILNEPIPRSIPTRERINRTSIDRMVSLSSTPISTNSQSTINEPKTIPLDYKFDDMFRGLFNEPVRGSANKSGQFYYVPPATSQSSGGTGILILAGVAIAGYFAYQKWRG